MEELKSELAKEKDTRKAQKLQKKIDKLAKFLAKTHVTANPRKEKARIVFEAPAPIKEGEKKEVSALTGQYNPLHVEQGWYSWWQKQGFFSPEYGRETAERTADGKKQPHFTMVLPPPNVTGTLHIGHAMMAAIEDAIARRKRMQGIPTLFLPGTDHAGIATQVVVEKMLEKEGTSRQALGRKAFLDRVWAWKSEHGEKITEQFKKLGASLDYSRERFTMDPLISKAVAEAFVRLYEAGLIYRGTRIVNWCAKIQTSLSDLEVEHVPVEPYAKVRTDGAEYTFGVIYRVRYDLVSSSESGATHIEVATTRPETVFVDAAICAHPKDPRYKHLEGIYAVNPLTGAHIPILFDESVEMEFGTGLLKVTPAHDPLDYEIGQRHGLSMESILDEHNRISSGDLQGMSRFAAREEAVRILRNSNHLIAQEGHAATIPVCSRTGEVVEPRILPQWWMKCSELARSVLGEDESQITSNAEEVPDTILVHPPEMQKTWRNWLSDTRDWCLSRQLWWGHRIPAYSANNKWYVARSEAEAEKMAGCPVVQEEDVLDTWFSSGLWPFAALGWPESTPDLRKYYPNSLLETGKDIVFFWVARMAMLGLALTGHLPFREVLFHSIVRDANGEKMSKSKGNVIDPVDVIEGISLENMLNRLGKGNLPEREIKKAETLIKQRYPRGIEACGSDALRLALLGSASLGRDVCLGTDKAESARRFCNKLWNAYKYALSVKEEDSSANNPKCISGFHEILDKWMETKMSRIVRKVNEESEAYNFLRAVSDAQHFWISEFCDFYIEAFKGRKDAAGICTLRSVSVSFLLLMHPFLPFVTEEIYQVLKRTWTETRKWKESIVIEEYPKPSALHPEPEKQVDQVLALVKKIRAAKASMLKAAEEEMEKEKEKKKESGRKNRESFEVWVSIRLDSHTEILRGHEPMLSRIISSSVSFSPEIQEEFRVLKIPQ